MDATSHPDAGPRLPETSVPGGDAALHEEALAVLRRLVDRPDARFKDGQFEAIEALVAHRRRPDSRTGVLMVLFALGVPVFAAFLAINVAGTLWLMGTAGFGMFTNSILKVAMPTSPAARIWRASPQAC